MAKFKLVNWKIAGGVLILLVVLVGGYFFTNQSVSGNSYERIGFLRSVYSEQFNNYLVFDDATVVFGSCNDDNCKNDTGIKNLLLANKVRVESATFADQPIVSVSAGKLEDFIQVGEENLQKTAFVLTIVDGEVISIKEVEK